MEVDPVLPPPNVGQNMFDKENTNTQQTATSSSTTTHLQTSTVTITNLPLQNPFIQQPIAVLQPPPPEQIVIQLTQNSNLPTNEARNNMDDTVVSRSNSGYLYLLDSEFQQNSQSFSA